MRGESKPFLPLYADASTIFFGGSLVEASHLGLYSGSCALRRPFGASGAGWGLDGHAPV